MNSEINYPAFGSCAYPIPMQTRFQTSNFIEKNKLYLKYLSSLPSSPIIIGGELNRFFDFA